MRARSFLPAQPAAPAYDLLQGFQWRNPHFTRYNDTSCQDFLQGTKQGVSPPHLRMVLDAAVVACLAQQARGQQIGADAVPASADSGDAEPASADSEDSVPASADAGDAGMVTQQHCAQQAAACAAAGEEAEQRPPAVLDAAADARAAVAQGSSAGDGGWLSVFQRSMRDALDSSWTKKGLRVSELCGIKPCSHCSAQTALDGLLATASAAASSIQVADFLLVNVRICLPLHFCDCINVEKPAASKLSVLLSAVQSGHASRKVYARPTLDPGNVSDWRHTAVQWGHRHSPCRADTGTKASSHNTAVQGLVVGLCNTRCKAP